MKKINELNKMFNPLGYRVYERNNTQTEVYDLYVLNSPRGLEWFGEIPAFRKIKDIDPKSVISCIEDINENRILPAYCFDPMFNKEFKNQIIFREYLRSLEFENAKWNSGYPDDTMVKKDVYGNICFTITLSKNNVYTQSDNAIVSCDYDFNNYSSLIDAIDSLIRPYSLVSLMKNIKIVEKQKGVIKGLTREEVIGLNLKITSMKEEIISKLEEALKQLKE